MVSVAGTVDSRLVLSAQGVAELAGVRRPVVSMWSRRFGPSHEVPFPRPISTGGACRYDAGEIVSWLVDTGHGNNSTVASDVALHARPLASFSPDGLSALLTLRLEHDAPLGGLDHDDLLDLAEAADPDDEFLLAEVEALGERVVQAAHYVDRVAAAATNPSAAHAAVLAGTAPAAAFTLSDECAALVAELAVELALTNPACLGDETYFVDPSGNAGDRLVDIVALLGEGAVVSIATPNGGAAALRALRRRLFIAGVAREGLEVGKSGEFDVTRAAINVAQYSASKAVSSAEILDAIDNIALQLSDEQRAVVIAPASVLVDGGLNAQAQSRRDDLLRSSRVRAIVRLPRGTVPAHPQQRLAVWVLGAAHSDVPAAERWTLTADVAELSLSARADLIGDLAASLGSHETTAAHAFSVGRRVPSGRLAAGTGPLVEAGPMGAPAAAARRDAHTTLERLAATEAAVAAPLSSGIIDLVRANPSDARSLPSTLRELKSDRHVSLRPGTRIATQDIGGGDGFRVIGAQEVRGEVTIGSRSIDRERLVRAYHRAQLTEPGDVVFVTSPRPRAVVDADGFSVVVTPARILRINEGDPNGLVPQLLALDVNCQAAQSTDWRSWAVRRVGVRERAGLRAVHERIDAARAQLHARLDDLDELERLMADGTTSGLLTTTEGTD